MAMYAVNYDGLRKRDTYNEIIDYLQFHQEKITYPDRFAKRTRETPQLTNLLDGEGLGHAELQELDKKRAIDMMKEFAIRESGGTAQLQRTNDNSTTVSSSGTPNNYHNEVQEFNDMLHTIIEEDIRNNEQQLNNTTQNTNNALGVVNTQHQNFLLGGYHMLPNNPKAPPPLPPPPGPVPGAPGSSTDGVPQHFRNATPKSFTKAPSLGLLRQAGVPKATQPQINQAMMNDPWNQMVAQAQGRLAAAKAAPDTPIRSRPPTPPMLTNNELAIVNQILGMTTIQIQQELARLGLPFSGDRNDLIERLAVARQIAPTAPIQQYIRRRPNIFPRINTPN